MLECFVIAKSFLLIYPLGQISQLKARSKGRHSPRVTPPTFLSRVPCAMNSPSWEALGRLNAAPQSIGPLAWEQPGAQLSVDPAAAGDVTLALIDLEGSQPP